MQALNAADLPDLRRVWPRLAQPPDGPHALLLDFDGTLVPRATDPSSIRVDASLRGLLEAAQRRVPVAIVTGRDLDDIRDRLPLPGLYYAGCHGLQLAGPGLDEHAAPADAARQIEALVPTLRAALAPWPAVIIEAKRFAVSVHLGAVTDGPAVRDAVADIVSKAPGLASSPAAAAVEVRPDLPIDKGTAVARLIAHFEATTGRPYAPCFLGDDRTDEDAFAEVGRHANGVAVIVGRPPRPTRARFALEGVQDVRAWLATFAETRRP